MEVIFECETCGIETEQIAVCSVCGKFICKECIYRIGYDGYQDDVFCSTCINPNYSNFPITY